jgi:hypothetical protein
MPNMFRELENLNFYIVSDFDIRASNFEPWHLYTYDQLWCDFHKLVLRRGTRIGWFDALGPHG